MAPTTTSANGAARWTAPLAALRVATLAVAALLGCGGETPPDARPRPAPPPADATREILRWHRVQVEKSAGECARPDAACARFSVAYPELAGLSEPAGRALSQAVSGLALAPLGGSGEAESLEAAAEGFLDAWRRARGAHPDAASTWRWHAGREIAVIYADRRVVSFEVSDEVDTGGAHPVTDGTIVTYALTSGAEVTLGSLVADGRLPAVEGLAEAAFRRAREIPASTPLAAVGFTFADGRFSLDRAAVAIVDGPALRFYFAPYAVAPWALGPTDFVVPWEELRELVRGDAPIGAGY